jgi:hypothetical protein
MSNQSGPAYEPVRPGDIVGLYEHWLHTAEIKDLENRRAEALWQVVLTIHAALSSTKPDEADVEWRRAYSTQGAALIRRAVSEAAARKAGESDSQHSS